MKAGKLRHNIAFEANTATALPNGEPATPSWVPFASDIAASIRPATPREVLKGQELGHVVTHVIEMRYLPNIVPQMRILFGSRVFEIAGPPINPEERNISLTIYAKETT
jgi:head-tail adaptor